jgi:hypothetical protein
MSKSKDGYKFKCKSCEKEQQCKYYQNNKEKIISQCHEYYQNNKEKIHKRARRYDLDNVEKVKEIHKKYYIENKENINQSNKNYYDKNRNKILEYHKTRFKDPEVKNRVRKRYNRRLKTDPMFRLRSYFGTRLYISLKGNKHGLKWETIVGYTLQELKNHLESKFDENMTWENYGSYWHIDHIVPVNIFNFTSYNDEQFKKCWSLENLQPMCGIDNIRKGNIISEAWDNIGLAARFGVI